MTPELSTHLSEEAIDDVLIGLGSPESDAHLAACSHCRGQLEQFRSEMNLFNQASLAWSKAKSATILRAAPRPKARPALPAPAGWVLAAAALLAIGLPVWNHAHRSPAGDASDYASTYAPAPASPAGDSEAQIAEDNDLLRSVNAALNSNEVSPISEYHLSDGPHPRHPARPELRNR
jgi:predicted anti-sigma-YlaC factor YlaD